MTRESADVEGDAAEVLETVSESTVPAVPADPARPADDQLAFLERLRVANDDLGNHRVMEGAWT